MSKEKTGGQWLGQIKPINFENTDHDLVYTRKAANLPLEKTHIQNRCNMPSTTLSIDYMGRIFMCECDGHLPFPVGNIRDKTTYDQLLSGDIAKSLIKSVSDKKFTYCDTKNCGIQHTNKMKPVRRLDINLGIDLGCNYACPSCRERIVLDNSFEFVDTRKTWVDNIYTLIQSAADRDVTVLLGGNGEPFVSELYIYALKQLLKLDNVRFSFRTNGSKLIKHKDLFVDLKDKIDYLHFSIDAATKDTYEIVRRPGKWENLLSNLDLIKSHEIKSTASFVVQVDNFREMPLFVEFCNSYNMIPQFTSLVDWGSWHNFNEHVVNDPKSVYYDEFQQIISTMPVELVRKFLK
jgi:wyosine [tRNA(Phe)-imidazoG37] synthetase (radical SAM superfamily)